MVKVTIKKATGEVKPPAAPAPPGEWLPEPKEQPQITAGVTSDGEEWEYKPVPEYMDALCARLAKMPAGEMGLKQDVYIAAALGFGSHKAHLMLWEDKFADEWPYIIPWFTRPEAGDWILPPEARWSIAKTKDGGEAWLKIGEQTWEAKALVPWAAFAICLLQARRANAFKVKNPKGARG